MSRPIALGIAGTGWMAETLAAVIAAREGARVAAVLSGSAERAAALAGRFKARPATETAAFLDGLDAVYVGAANAAHAGLARAALAAGLPVLVEKPLTTAAAETAALVAQARARGTLLMENYWTLALPGHRRLKALCHGGDLGAPRHLAFDFSYPVTADVFPGLFDPAQGGVLRDRAVYGLAAAIDLLGPVAEARAEISRDAAGCDTAAALMLRHAGGATAQVSVSMVSGGPNTLELGFARGHARLAPSLGAERLEIATLTPPAARQLAGGGLKARIKQSPVLRRLKGMRPAGGEFHPYGSSLYAPVVAHFLDLVAARRPESDLVPLTLSTQVADLLERLRNS